jgi:hypothetical protein
MIAFPDAGTYVTLGTGIQRVNQAVEERVQTMEIIAAATRALAPHSPKTPRFRPTVARMQGKLGAARLQGELSSLRAKAGGTPYQQRLYQGEPSMAKRIFIFIPSIHNSKTMSAWKLSQ